MEELQDIEDDYHPLGASQEDEATKPLLGRFEESSSLAQPFIQGQDLILIEREKDIEFIGGFETEEQFNMGLLLEQISTVKFLPVHRERVKRLNIGRIALFAFLYALIARVLNMENLVVGVELLLGIILAVLQETNRKEKRQMVLIKYTKGGREEYLKLSFKGKNPIKERWKELWNYEGPH